MRAVRLFFPPSPFHLYEFYTGYIYSPTIMTDIQKIEKKKKSTRKLHHKTSVEPSFFERCVYNSYESDSAQGSRCR